MRRVAGRRAALGFERFAAVGRAVAFFAALDEPLLAEAEPPSCAVELAIGSASSDAAAKTVASRGVCRGKMRREKITMFDLATGVPGTAKTAGLSVRVPDRYLRT